VLKKFDSGVSKGQRKGLNWRPNLRFGRSTSEDVDSNSRNGEHIFFEYTNRNLKLYLRFIQTHSKSNYRIRDYGIIVEKKHPPEISPIS